MSKFNVGDRVSITGKLKKSKYAERNQGATDIVIRTGHDYVMLSRDLENGGGGCWDDEVELITEEKEVKRTHTYMKGDKVRCVGRGWSGTFTVGNIYTVRESTNNHIVNVELNDSHKFGSWYAANLEIVQEALGTLEETVQKLNEYRKFVKEAFDKYAGQIERNYNGNGWRDRGSVVASIEYRAKAKPAFEPWTTKEGWQVTVVGHDVRVGCKIFKIQFLVEVFADLTERNLTTSADFKSTRKGIYLDSHVLNWYDAAKILADLRKI